jgi:pyruvate dehydrogenase E1 component alpha subunit
MTVSSNKKIQLYKSMLRIRRVEETLAELYKQQKMRTPTHLGIGQEAVATGVCEALAMSDVIYTHHRSHSHYLAKGGNLVALVAELYGRETGCSRGRGGSVHIHDPKAGVIASAAILGETVATAVGSALAFAMDKKPRVAVSFFGDAVFEEGILYECFNFAALRKLPVLFVCENNGYSTESPVSVRQPPGTQLLDRARAFGIRSLLVDGNDVIAVYKAALAAVGNCRSGEGPVCLEFTTYRWREHVGPYFDFELGRTYRSEAETREWMANCPVRRCAEGLLAEKLATEEVLATWANVIEEEIQAAVVEALKGAWPDFNSLLDNVY